MADLPISSLPLINGAEVQPSDDLLALADVSTSETKSVTPTGVVSAALTKTPAEGGLPTNSIPPNKINWDAAADGSIPGDAVDLGDITIPPNSVGIAQLQDGAVTTEKIANSAITNEQLDSSVVDPDGGLTLNAEGIAIDNTIATGTFAGITYNEHGLITGVDPSGQVPSISLPIATETTTGVVSIPATGGLSVTAAGEVSHTNTLTAGSFAGITYDNHGHVTSVSPDGKVPAGSIPIAGTTSSEIGGIYVPPNDHLSVDADGKLSHTANTTAGEYTKVLVDTAGHVTGGGSLTANDIPGIEADKIVGQIGSGQLEDCCITAPKICDYATVLMQEDNPGQGDFLGQLWWTPSTAQLYIYARGSGPENLWRPVGFGSLQQNNLRWGGAYDADTDTITVLTSIGVSSGLTAGQPFPPPSDGLSGLYFICQNPGNSMTQNNLQGINHDAGDWALCLDAAQGWLHINANAAGGGGGGGAQYLNDLLDVEIGGSASPFSTAPAVALSRDQILRYDGGAGLWRNTDIIDGGTY